MSKGSTQNPLTVIYSITDCAQIFASPQCYEGISYLIVNCAIWIYLSYQIAIILCRDGLARIPKTKTVILVVLWVCLLSEIVFEIKWHWAYYLYMLFDYGYFLCIVYYFGKKILKAYNRLDRLKSYKLCLCVFISALIANFIYSNVQYAINHTTICNENQYIYQRFLGLALEILLAVIGYRLNKILTEKLEDRQVATLKKERLQNIRQNILALSKLIIVFLISQSLLLFRALYFKFGTRGQCLFFAQSPYANLIVSICIEVLSNFLPKCYTIKLFSLKIQSETEDQLQVRPREQTRYFYRQTMLIRKLSVITDSTNSGTPKL